MTKANLVKIVVIVVLITIIHITISRRMLTLHIVLRALYFIPIAYAALLTGRKGGLIAAAIISLLFLPHFFFSNASPEFSAGNALAIILFFLCGLVIGNFRDATKIEYSRKLSRDLIVPFSKESRQKILFYVDGTSLSEGAAEWFANHYVLEDKSITLLSISTKDREEATAERLSGREELDECLKLAPELDKIKAILVSKGIEKSKIETVCIHKTERAPISEKISLYAQEHGFDLVLVCKHEKKKSEEFLFGDTAIQLVRNTTIPLLVLKGVEEGQASPV